MLIPDSLAPQSAEASDDLLFRNPNHADDSVAWPDEEVDEEEAQDELDANVSTPIDQSTSQRMTATATTGKNGQAEEEDMDNVEALMAGVKLDEAGDKEVRA